MTDFQYDGVTSEGKPCQGSVRAPNVDTARLRLIGQGITPVRLTGGEAAPAQGMEQSRSAKLKRQDILFFSREMAHLKQANMPLDKALAMLKEMAATDALRAFISKVEEGVRGGKSLYQSLLPFERDLGRQYLVLIRAGETSGSLHVVMKELTVQLEAQDKLRNYVISSMTYPIILLVVAVLSVVLLLAFVVPQFREIFDSMGDALPYSTQLVVNLSDLIRSHWMLILLGVTMLFFLLSRWVATAAGRMQLDTMLLDMPLFGKVVKNLQFAVYFRTFGILLQRGVPMVDALRIAVDTLTNVALRKDIEPLVGIVKTGKRLSTGFVSPHFKKTTAPQLIRVAEETGQLDSTLLSLADRYEDEGRRTMGRVLAAMEPLIIIILGAFVAFIIIAILGGVLSINDTI
ncbi:MULTISPECIES: type II secretion system F family protein [unclassified Simplicispira]|uniref:type II secretion system F family protein n=1 Tax=unclassified Simplicispira TaxID=2630407 RepID=UPI000D5D8427|nr:MULTISPECIES: type II secretion system F family protein [unclassified Simplicispira]PVY58112.1 general secretion pathway protein F [Simplicispira sp. 125]REG15477.1 general secretion pathway protein F [Simplicispira sp. 110]